ncbi:MAG: hypothetical protein ACLQDV_24300 [Candidatus Binataceae bacterium]
MKEINDLLFAYVTRGLKPPPKPSAVPLDAKIDDAVGFYEFASPRSQWSQFLTELTGGWTYIDHGDLYRRGPIPGSREKLVYLGGGQIRAERESAASGVYCSDQDGHYGCGALSCFQRISPVWPITRLVLIATALLVMATSILFGLVWIPRKLIGRMRGVQHLSVRALPLLAILSLLGMVWRIWGEPAMALGRPDAVTLTIFVLSIVFPVLSIAALVTALRSFRFEINRAMRIHSLLVAVACVWISWFFAYWGLIAVRVWAL